MRQRSLGGVLCVMTVYSSNELELFCYRFPHKFVPPVSVQHVWPMLYALNGVAIQPGSNPSNA